MTALDQDAVFRVISGDPLLLTATLWRGAMIERFAQIEFFIDRTLASCVAAAIVSRAAADSTLPRARCKVLLGALEQEPLLAKADAASRSLKLIYDMWDERNALCHGRMKVGATSIGIHYTAYGKSHGEARLVRLTPLEMLKKLSDLDRLKMALGSQLGWIDKHCASLSA